MKIDTFNQVEIIENVDDSICYLEHGWPSDLIRWHAHAPYELHLMVSTHGKVFVGDHIGRYKPGQLILVGPHVPHNWVTNKDEPSPVDVRDMVIVFSHNSIERILEGFSEMQELMSMLELSLSGVEFVDFDMEEAISLFSKVRDETGMERLLAFLQLLTRLKSWPHKRTLSTAKLTSPMTNSAANKINEVVQYIADHYQENLSLGKMSAMINMSESAFSRHFAKSTGNKFVEFVNRVRIGRACIQLAETNDQISAICFDVGFNNITNFNRHFVKLKGKTPGEYRRIIQTNLGKDQSVVKPTIAIP
jgi:AraC-like DNA-binding protein